MAEQEEALLLTIDEEEEPLGGEEEVPMEEVDDLLGEDPPTQEEQEPPVSTMEEDPHMQEEQEPQEGYIIEPHPNDTTMEVDADSTTTFGDLVGEIIENITLNGDKSPRESSVVEIDLVEEIDLANGDKSPEILEVEIIENDDKSSEAEPDEIEIMDNYGINFSRNTSTPPPQKPLSIVKTQRPFMSLKLSIWETYLMSQTFPFLGPLELQKVTKLRKV